MLSSPQAHGRSLQGSSVLGQRTARCPVEITRLLRTPGPTLLQPSHSPEGLLLNNTLCEGSSASPDTRSSSLCRCIDHCQLQEGSAF